MLKTSICHPLLAENSALDFRVKLDSSFHVVEVEYRKPGPPRSFYHQFGRKTGRGPTGLNLKPGRYQTSLDFKRTNRMVQFLTTFSSG